MKETKIETVEIPEAVVNALDDALEEFEKIKRSISVESTAKEQPLLKPSKSITMTFRKGLINEKFSQVYDFLEKVI